MTMSGEATVFTLFQDVVLIGVIGLIIAASFGVPMSAEVEFGTAEPMLIRFSTLLDADCVPTR